MSLTFSTVGKPTLQIGGHTKELSKEAMLEVLQLVISHVAGTRDYTNVVSVNKLLKIIELECEPDESDGESEPSPVNVAPQAVKEEEPVRRPAARAQRRPAGKKEDDE